MTAKLKRLLLARHPELRDDGGIGERDPRIDPEPGDFLVRRTRFGSQAISVAYGPHIDTVGKTTLIYTTYKGRGKNEFRISLRAWLVKVKDAAVLRLGPAPKKNDWPQDERVLYGRLWHEKLTSFLYPKVQDHENNSAES